MDIRFLTTFLDLVETRHFGKTADNLYLTQSAVSARIKHLEEYFHTHLFIRQRNSLQLTPAGEKLVPYAHKMCSTLHEARSDLNEQLSDYIAIGATPAIGELLLPLISKQVNQSFPDWLVKAETMTLETLSRRLHDRSIDLAITTEPLKSDDVDHSVLFETDLAVYVPKQSNPQQLKDYVGLEWVQKKPALQDQFSGLTNKVVDTNSLNIALAAQKAHSAAICLPVQHSSPLLTVLEDIYASTSQLEVLNDGTLTIYASLLKPIQRSSTKHLLSLLDTLQ